MGQDPLMRASTVLLLAGVLLALVPSAGAHVTVTPPFLAVGAESTVSFDAPNERERAMTALELVAPDGVELLGADAPTGWRADVAGSRVTWTGGSLAPGATVLFPIRLRARGEPRTVVFRAVQRFEDGAAVPWDASLTLVPGAAEEPDQHPRRALVAALVGVGGDRREPPDPAPPPPEATSGGIAATAATVAPVIFTQFVDDDLGCASYLVGDEEAGTVVVVDPAYAVEQYLEEAERRDARLVRVLETHTHADHVSGHGRLALEHGVPVSIHGGAEAAYPNEPLADGDEIEVGAVVLRCLHTPGHRPEHCCFAVSDRSRGDEPWLVLTGDSLFVGDAARPDLAVEAREGATDLHASLQRLLELPDGVEVFPGHVAGSLCGKAMSAKASTTIGFERRFNAALATRDVEAFVAESAAAGVPKPPNAARIVDLNRGPFLAAPAEVAELAGPPGEAQLLDVRPVRSFLEGHRPGAMNVPVSGTTFATKAGFVLDADRSVCVVASDASEAEQAIRSLRAVAIMDVAGYLLGGGPDSIEPVALPELEALVAEGVEVIDVREKDERDTGYIPGSRNIPYRLLTVCGADVPTDRPVVTICSTGARAAVAASILAARGVDARPVLGAGVGDWAAHGGTTVEFRRCGSQ